MLALSPPLFSTTYGWPMEDPIVQNLSHDCNEANSYSSLLDFRIYDDQIERKSVPEYSNSSGGVANGGGGDSMKVEKKLNHNASERDRRKRVNELYTFLRSLLPISSDQKKKVSIPGTVSRALKYIPELQKEVEILKRKKEKLSSYSTSTANTRREHLGIKKQSAKVSVNILGDKEVVIQLISSTDHMSKNKEINHLSKVLEYLEQEEDGLVLINATAFKCLGEGMLLSTLHLQVQGDQKIAAEKLKEKLSAFNH
ncbi:hypothetical protein L1987_04357 [Smallanthus sonchifolius]|uniref:Uncharacterized protein n=1 Tax=Smallanthus sonchifolius TaxID=185202 RepID=A0ACB9KD75_9ASTR|nr:hypothetical protein L1987_04357 [Smallanthus sonchifolius]